MNNLTQIEQALLQEFENLAATFADLAQQQSQLSDHFSAKIEALNQRQTQLETQLSAVSEALMRQTASTNDLINKTQRLIGNWN